MPKRTAGEVLIKNNLFVLLKMTQRRHLQPLSALVHGKRTEGKATQVKNVPDRSTRTIFANNPIYCAFLQYGRDEIYLALLQHRKCILIL